MSFGFGGCIFEFPSAHPLKILFLLNLVIRLLITKTILNVGKSRGISDHHKFLLLFTALNVIGSVYQESLRVVYSEEIFQFLLDVYQSLASEISLNFQN